MNIRAFVNKYFSFILLIAGAVGLFIPDPGDIASYLILIMLFTIIFASSFQLDLKKEVFIYQSRNAIIFTVLRFIIVPVIFFLVLRFVSEFYAFVLFFLLILPAAVASPPVTVMYARHINLSLMIMAFSSIAATITIPVFVPLVSEGVTTINPLNLFQTVFITIVLPFFVHLLFRKKQNIKKWMTLNLSYVTVICISMILMLAISKNKHIVFQQPDMVGGFIVIALIFYLGLFVMGWHMMPTKDFNNKATFTISSGMNNIGLGISLAILYLPPIVAVFCIMAQFAWIISLIPVRFVLGKIQKNLGES